MRREPFDREGLLAAARGVLSGECPHDQVTHDQVPLVTENGVHTTWGDALPNRLTDSELHAYAADVDRQSVVVFGTGSDMGRSTVFSVHVSFDEGSVRSLELVVAHEGEASLFPATIPIGDMPYIDEVLELAHRTPRRDMIRAAEAYFDGIEMADGQAVPTTQDCKRVENGYLMAGEGSMFGWACDDLSFLTYISTVRDRRYPVIDVERGLVVGIVMFDIPGGDFNGLVYEPRSLLLVEIFRIEEGMIRHIEATMRNLELGSTTGWIDDL